MLNFLRNVTHPLKWWHQNHPKIGVTNKTPLLREITREMAIIAEKPLTINQCLRDIDERDKRIATEVSEYMIDIRYELDNIVKRFQNGIKHMEEYCYAKA